MDRGRARRMRVNGWQGIAGGIAVAGAFALAGCGGDGETTSSSGGNPNLADLSGPITCLEDQGYGTNQGGVNPASRRSGTTAVLTVLLQSEDGAVEDTADVYYWDSSSSAARYVKDVGAGPLDDLEHEQIDTVTVTHSKTLPATDVDAITGCVA